MNLDERQKDLQQKIKERQSKLDLSGFAKGYKSKPLTELEIAQRETCKAFEEYEELVQEEFVLEMTRRNRERAIHDLEYIMLSLQAYLDYKSDANRVDREDPQNALFVKFGTERYDQILVESYKGILLLVYKDLIEVRQRLNIHHDWTGFCRRSIDQVLVETLTGYDYLNNWIDGSIFWARKQVMMSDQELLIILRSL